MRTLLYVCLLNVISHGWASDPLIRELLQLRTEVSKQSVDYQKMTLRLADVLFDHSIQESSDQEIIKKRHMAVENYLQVLEGREGVIPAELKLAEKIHFQLGRLYEKIRDIKKSSKHFIEVVNSQASNEMKREALLYLGEFAEDQGNWGQSANYFSRAVKFCHNVSTCSYVHHRRAWNFYRMGKNEEAIKEMKLALWDKDNKIKEQSLQDYILFHSQMTGQEVDRIGEFIEISKKIGDQKLLKTLADAFYAAGNREAAVLAYEKYLDKNQDFFISVRLLEEYLGFQNWAGVSQMQQTLKTKTQEDLPDEQKEQDEVLKILRRVVVQLDGTRKTDSHKKKFLKESIEIYLTLYPRDDLLKNMREGWLAATDDSQEKISRLAAWIKEEQNNGEDPRSSKFLVELRHARLALVQESKELTEVIIEAKSLSELVPAKEREYTYLWAKAAYDLKDFTTALPLFQSLAQPSPEPDQWAIFSQNLALDIYNQKQDFIGLSKQASLWSLVTSADKKLQTEIDSFKLMKQQALFQLAVQKGESQEALEDFYSFCERNIFSTKSCQNAKVLAIKLKDQRKLIALLEKEKDEKALLVEYEAMGEFFKAAEIYEKTHLKPNADLTHFFKGAMLYELAFDLKNRDRIIAAIIVKVKKLKELPEDIENLLYMVLIDSGKMDETMLSLPWSLGKKVKLAESLDGVKTHNPSKKLILSQEKMTGASWAKYALSELEDLYHKQSKLSFYGQGSEWKFNKRVKALDQLASHVNRYLPGADTELRLYILSIINNAYQKFLDEIASTPLPEGLDDETLAQIHLQLQEVAAPFKEAWSRYQKLASEQMIIASQSLDLPRIQKNIEQEKSFSQIYRVDTALSDEKSLERISMDDYQVAITELRNNPESLDALEILENIYRDQRFDRLATYFSSRRNQLSISKGRL